MTQRGRDEASNPRPPRQARASMRVQLWSGVQVVQTTPHTDSRLTKTSPVMVLAFHVDPLPGALIPNWLLGQRELLEHARTSVQK